MIRKHLHTLLITCLALLSCVTAQAGLNEWTVNPKNSKELLYTYKTKTYDYAGYKVYGEITFSFVNERVNRVANDNWKDFHMRIGTVKENGVTYQTSGYVKVVGTDANGFSHDLSNYCHFHYYNSNINENKKDLVEYSDFPVWGSAWWDMDVQSSIKLFFHDYYHNVLETVRIPRPIDTEVKCYSTTEGSLLTDQTLLVRHYRTNLLNRYNQFNQHMNKGVMYVKNNGDGTYLFDPVWEEFKTTDAYNNQYARNKYKQNALGWTGQVGSDKVVVAPKGTDGKYRLTINALLPIATIEEQKDGLAYTLLQAIVRAPKGAKVRMSVKAWDYVDRVYKMAETDGAVVAGVGIDDTRDLTKNTAYGTVNKHGRVDYLKREANGGWLKLEFPVRLKQVENKPGQEMESRGYMILTSDQEFEVSDIFMLWRPNQPGYYQTSANYNPNKMGDYDMNTSYIDLTAEKKFSLFDRGDNLNRVVKVNANTTFALKGHEHPCNVLVEGKNMPLLYLTDRGVLTHDNGSFKANTGVWIDKNRDKYMKSGYTFGVDEGFTADKVWFDRNFAYTTDANGKSHSMSTICLPFAMNATELSKFNVSKAYEFMKAKGNTATFQEVTSTEADTPYLIEPNEAITTANETPIEFVNKQIPASNIATGDFIGTYQYRNLPAKDGEYTNYIFGFNTQKFNYVKSTGASFKPFRAYLRSKQQANKAKSIVLQLWDGSTTDIMNIDNTTAPSPNAPLYTIDGRMVSPTGNCQNLPKGIYIQNGKKFVK
ncbi:hypothetical protein HMPREF0645_0416 [Hallella bergensis DSM 17361]|uniref:Uncharacterized protein n=1 Tax=Hallella bergensis DSM 17361 TaxID=585502 RepID=D1PTY1_9BACT|nr:hypothetical protein [Hallella bergensis]EFA45189.1 hypothetical protein HMPREF0645_0416 [Hallella bergensis DSM 17361]